MSSHSKKTKSNKANAHPSASKVSGEQRQQYIEVAAYHIAKSGGFNSGCDVENWLAAEAEIDQLLAGGKL